MGTLGFKYSTQWRLLSFGGMLTRPSFSLINFNGTGRKDQGQTDSWTDERESEVRFFDVEISIR